MKLTIADYPLAEMQGDKISGKRGKALDGITLALVLAGEVTMADLQITPTSLQKQAEISADAGRPTLALNFQRASEMVEVPQEVIMSTYELLRPGRARSKAELYDRAAILRDTYKANSIADYIIEAADIYEKRGLFTRRY